MNKQNYDMNEEEIEHVRMFDKLIRENDYPELSYSLGIDKNTKKRRLIITYMHNGDIIALGEVFYPDSKNALEIDFAFNEPNGSDFTYEDLPQKRWYQFWRRNQ